MNVRRTGIALLVTTTLAAGIGAGTALTGSTASPGDVAAVERDAQAAPVAAPAWLRALAIRSEALNDEYEWLRVLATRSEALNDEYAWLRALAIRSEAMNEEYAWLRALAIRSEALNAQYGLGEYGPG